MLPVIQETIHKHFKVNYIIFLAARHNKGKPAVVVQHVFVCLNVARTYYLERIEPIKRKKCLLMQ